MTIIGAAGDALVYERRHSIYPSDRPGQPAPAVLVEGQHGAGDFRLYYECFADRVTLSMEHRDALGDGWGYWLTTMERGWSGPEPYPMSTSDCRVAGELFVAGMVTSKVARVSFNPMDDDGRVDLPTYSLADVAEIRAYGGFVGDPPRGSYLLAYDAHDAELGPPFEPYWRLPRDPI